MLSIVKEGEYGDILYYLENWVCKTKKRVEIGKKEVPWKDIKKGDLIGIDCFLKGKLRDETVIDVKVVGLSLDEFVDLFDDVVDIMRRKMKFLLNIILN